MSRNNEPFYDWIPRPVGIAILLFMFFPPTFSGGAYLSNISEMTGGLGVLSEDIQLAAFFTSIGMCLFPPFMIRYLQARRVKHTFVYCFAALIGLNFVCAYTTSVAVLCLACLAIGVLRVIIMLNCTFTIAPYLTGMNTLAMFTMQEQPTPDEQYAMERKRTFLMPVLYCVILIIAQLSNIFSAWVAETYHWQYTYVYVNFMLTVAILLVVVTMPSMPNKNVYRFEYKLLPDVLLMAVALCSMTIVLCYGKTLDWLDNRVIVVSLAVFLLSVGVFLLMSANDINRHYLPLKVFKYRNVIISMLLFAVAMIFNSASSFIGSYAKLCSPISNFHSASLSWYAIIGCVIGFVLSMILVVKKVKFRTIFAVALAIMAMSNVYMYFNIQDYNTYSNMRMPMVLNYTGLLMMYSLVAAFGMKSLPSRYLVTFVFLMIWMRNAIAPVVGASIYSNWFYEKQQYYYERMVSAPETNSIKSVDLQARVMKQSALLAMKDISGITVWLMLGSVVLVLILPYHKKETT